MKCNDCGIEHSCTWYITDEVRRCVVCYSAWKWQHLQIDPVQWVTELPDEALELLHNRIEKLRMKLLKEIL